MTIRVDAARGLILPLRIRGVHQDAWTYATIDPTSPENRISEALARRIGALPLGQVAACRACCAPRLRAISQVDLCVQVGGLGKRVQTYRVRRLPVVITPRLRQRVGLAIGTITLSRVTMTLTEQWLTLCI